jgi:hypothetical protein
MSPSVQAADLNQVEAAYRPYYEAFNATLAQLSARENALRKEAEQSQELAARNLERGYTLAEQQRIAATDQLRRQNQDLQTQNRIRARAIGGAPSSAFLELANKTDLETGRQMAQQGMNYENRIKELDDRAFETVNKIEQDLLKAIGQIEADRTMSLRERDAAITQAKREAAARALAARQYGGMGGFGGFGFDFGGGEPQMQAPQPETGRVLGAATAPNQAIAVDVPADLLDQAQLAHNLKLNDNPVAKKAGQMMDADLTGVIRKNIGLLAHDPRYKNLLNGRGGGGGRSGGF